jgi:hypothetical protein
MPDRNRSLLFSGACTDPLVFGRLMSLPDAPKWKVKKLTLEEFEQIFGQCEGSARGEDMHFLIREQGT